MIRFHYVKYRNFGSFGHVPNTVYLDKHRTTLVSGMNGHGKSFALLDSITFALFGKPFRKINIPQLVNTINEKDCIVEVSFSIGEDTYKVIRGIKPKVFEIYKNDVLINQESKAKDYQRMLEESILKMNYKSFTQVVILGSSSFVPFMQLSPQDRREVIEDVLDIQVFSEMNLVLKSRASLKKEEIKDMERDLDLVKSKISVLENHIEALKENDESKISLLKDEIRATASVNKTKDREISVLLEEQTALLKQTEKIGSIKTSLSKHEHTKRLVNQSLDTVRSKTEKMESMDNCPTCTQSISDETKNKLINEYEEKRSTFENGLVDLERKIEQANKELDEMREVSAQLSSVQEKIISARGEMESNRKYANKLLAEIRSIENKSNEGGNNESCKELNEYKSQCSEMEEKRQELKEEGMLLGCVGNLLKDTGIKSKIIRHYLPVINKLINKFLSDMGFFAQFHLDDNFNETIKSRHRDTFSYMSFSEGEKMRIDLALLLAWREVARIKNSANTNLLILDEVFDSSLDSVGTDEFLKLLNTLSTNTNVFVISHKSDQLIDKFENQITFVKKGNFSRIA